MHWLWYRIFRHIGNKVCGWVVVAHDGCDGDGNGDRDGDG